MSEQENTKVEETPKPKLSKVLRGISQLLLSGLYTGAHSQILFESVGILEVLANAEEAKEKEAEPKLEVVPDPVEEPATMAEEVDTGTGILGSIVAGEGEKPDVQDGV